MTPISKKSLLAGTLAVCLASGTCPAQNPPDAVDLTKFPGASVEDVVVPVPSEIFAVLDKLGSPDWRAELSPSLGKNTGNRPQVAMLLGTVIAEGFVAVEAEDAAKVREIGREVLALAEAINVRKAVIARSKSITEKADAKDWRAVRREFDGALNDVRGAMEELGDNDLAQLVSVGGWLRGTEVLTSVVSKNFSPDGAELLFQPRLVEHFSSRLDKIRSSRLGRDPLVALSRKTLSAIQPLVDVPDGSKISEASVKKIHALTSATVRAITSGEAP